jgi:uncharacterized protein (TIGR03437 family)
MFGLALANGDIITPYPWPTEYAFVRVLVNRRASPLLFLSAGQINFMIPPDTPPGEVDVQVRAEWGDSPIMRVTVRPATPGIFFDSSTGYGAILNAGTADRTQNVPAARGSAVEIYCTGLGAVQDSGLRETVMRPSVTIGNLPAQVVYSGHAGGYVGLYQVNAIIPEGLSPGAHDVRMTVNGVTSNVVRIAVR